jgi:hypothetical protein
MRRPLNIVLVVIAGVVGGYLGYRLGVSAGWGTVGDWPWALGRARGSILLAFGLSVVFAVVAAVLIVYLQGRKVRQALDFGLPARATLVSIKRTGDKATTRDGTYDQVHCELDVKTRDGVTYRATITQFLTEAYLRTLEPGKTVHVRYDPAQRKSVAIIEPAGRGKRTGSGAPGRRG